MIGSKQTFFYTDEGIKNKAEKYYNHCFNEVSTAVAYNALNLISFEKVNEEDETRILTDGEYFLDKESLELCKEIIRSAFEMNHHEEQVYGTCPYCGYELTLENGTYSEDKNESDESIQKNLLEYHFDAELKCKAKKIHDELGKNFNLEYKYACIYYINSTLHYEMSRFTRPDFPMNVDYDNLEVYDGVPSVETILKYLE